MTFRERYLTEGAGHYVNKGANRTRPLGPGFQHGNYKTKEYKPSGDMGPGAFLGILGLLGAGAIAAGQ